MRCLGLELGGLTEDWDSSTVELSAIRRARSLDARVVTSTLESSTVELWAIQLYVVRGWCSTVEFCRTRVRHAVPRP